MMRATRAARRETGAGAWLESLFQDLSHALRGLRRSPAFTATAVLTLALGIGATTAVFTLIDQVMLRSLAVSNPRQLWRIGDTAACCYSTGYAQTTRTPQNDWSLFSWEAYRRFRADTPAFEDLAAFQIGTGNGALAVRRAGSPAAVQPLLGEFVSGNFFRTFGIKAWRGRLFTDSDDVEGAPPVAVMTFNTWQQKYGADPSVVGAVYDINGRAFTVVGITPPGFLRRAPRCTGRSRGWTGRTTSVSPARPNRARATMWRRAGRG